MSKYSYEEKMAVIQAYKKGKGNRIISREYGIPESTVKLRKKIPPYQLVW